MDTAISNGDFLVDSRGIPVVISGIQEILQRALIRLTIKKGSFIYDQDLGSDLYSLKVGSKNIKNEALNMVKEALEPLNGVIVDDVTVKFTNSGENLQLKAILSVDDKKGEVEVVL